MKIVYKYPLDNGSVNLPEGAQVLHVDAQFGVFMVWALVDPAENLERRQVSVVGTGYPIPEGDVRHISSFLMNSGELVFHAFEAVSS